MPEDFHYTSYNGHGAILYRGTDSAGVAHETFLNEHAPCRVVGVIMLWPDGRRTFRRAYASKAMARKSCTGPRSKSNGLDFEIFDMVRRVPGVWKTYEECQAMAARRKQ